jgi:hypothetical protein
VTNDVYAEAHDETDLVDPRLGSLPGVALSVGACTGGLDDEDDEDGAGAGGIRDTVEGERERGAEPSFTALSSVPGTVDNKADDAATDPMTVYTYRLRCKVGEVYSPYSNEASASPVP